MSQKIIVESLAMDLKRVALGLYRGSNAMANRFKEEALKRGAELEQQKSDVYLKSLLRHCRESLSISNNRSAEDALMFSTLFQNFALKKMGGRL